MKVTVDREACQGHNRCYLLCPQVFDVDDEGYAFVRVEVVPQEFERKVQLAARNCPERAIKIETSDQG